MPIVGSAGESEQLSCIVSQHTYAPAESRPSPPSAWPRIATYSSCSLELGPHMRQTPRGDGVVEIEVELPTVEEERGLRAAAGGLLRLSSVEPPAKIDAHP